MLVCTFLQLPISYYFAVLLPVWNLLKLVALASTLMLPVVSSFNLRTTFVSPSPALRPLVSPIPLPCITILPYVVSLVVPSILSHAILFPSLSPLLCLCFASLHINGSVNGYPGCIYLLLLCFPLFMSAIQSLMLDLDHTQNRDFYHFSWGGNQNGVLLFVGCC